MITRTLLFLLAMVTGFSAANAAESTRAVPSEIGASATVALLANIVDESSELSHASASEFCEKPVILALVARPAVYAVFGLTVVAPCTYRGDRTRE